MYQALLVKPTPEFINRNNKRRSSTSMSKPVKKSTKSISKPRELYLTDFPPFIQSKPLPPLDNSAKPGSAITNQQQTSKIPFVAVKDRKVRESYKSFYEDEAVDAKAAECILRIRRSFLDSEPVEPKLAPPSSANPESAVGFIMNRDRVFNQPTSKVGFVAPLKDRKSGDSNGDKQHFNIEDEDVDARAAAYIARVRKRLDQLEPNNDSSELGPIKPKPAPSSNPVGGPTVGFIVNHDRVFPQPTSKVGFVAPVKYGINSYSYGNKQRFYTKDEDVDARATAYIGRVRQRLDQIDLNNHTSEPEPIKPKPIPPFDSAQPAGSTVGFIVTKPDSIKPKLAPPSSSTQQVGSTVGFIVTNKELVFAQQTSKVPPVTMKDRENCDYYGKVESFWPEDKPVDSEADEYISRVRQRF